MVKIFYFALAFLIGLLLYVISPSDFQDAFTVTISNTTSNTTFHLKSSQLPFKAEDAYIYISSGNLIIETTQQANVFINDIRCYQKGKENGTYIYKMKLPKRAKAAGFVLGFAITLFIFTSRIHFVIPSLFILVLLPFLGVLSSKATLSSLSSPVVYIFLAGSAFEYAMRKTSLDREISKIVFMFAKNKNSLIITTILVSSLLSAIMSNTAATYVIMPIILSIASDGLKEPLLLSLVASTAIGGSLTIIGTPPNLIVASFIRDLTGVKMDFGKWIMFGLPTWLVGIPVIFFLTKIFISKKGVNKSFNMENRKFNENIKLNNEQKVTFYIIIITVVLWATSKMTNLGNGSIALLAVLMFLIFGIMEPNDIRKLRWDLVLLFGGGLSLGKALINSGWADWVVGKLPQPRNNLELFGMLTLLLIVGTAFSSHTSAAAFVGPVMIPLGMGISKYFGTNAYTFGTILVMLATLSINNAMALPISTPPSAIVFSSGKIKIKNMMLYGIIFGILMNSILVFLLKPLWLWLLK